MISKIRRWYRPVPLSLVIGVGILAAVPRFVAAGGANLGWVCVAGHAAAGDTAVDCRPWFDRVLAAVPSSTEAHDGLTAIAQAEGDFPEVLRHSAAGTGGGLAQLYRGLALHALGREAEAVAVWRQAQAQRYFFWQARAREDAGDKNEAITLYERVLAIDPGMNDPLWQHGYPYNFPGYLVRAYLAEGRASEAARTAVIWTTRPSAPGEASFLLGLSYLRGGRAADAIAPLREAASRDPRNWAFEAGWWLGQAYESLGDWDHATSAYLDVDRVSPSARTSHAIGAVWMQKGDRAQAIAAFRRAIAIDPQYHPSYLPLVLLLRQAGEREAARGVLADGLRRWPADAALRREMNVLEGR